MTATARRATAATQGRGDRREQRAEARAVREAAPAGTAEPGAGGRSKLLMTACRRRAGRDLRESASRAE